MPILVISCEGGQGGEGADSVRGPVVRMGYVYASCKAPGTVRGISALNCV